MASAHVSDPLTALRELVERVTPYDPEPAATGTVGIRYGHESGEFRLTPHLARALVEALSSYRDPADRGTCAGCVEQAERARREAGTDAESPIG